MYDKHKVLSHLEHLDLQYGQSHRGNCPMCNRKGTFTATFTDEGLVFNCYSLSCKASGNVKKDMTAEAIMERLRRSTVKETRTLQGLAPVGHDFEIPDRVVPADGNLKQRAQAFMDYWRINPDLSIYYDIKDDRVVFPVMGIGAYKNTVLDMVGRSLDKTVKPKWLRYGNTTQPFVYGPTGNRSCVVVEDVLSAIKAYEDTGVTGVALLGTQLTAEHRDFITMEFDSAIIALDRDALTKQLSISKELSAYMSGVKVCRLQDDIKYGHAEDANAIKAFDKELTERRMAWS